MRRQTKLPPETIAIRQMLATAAAAFVLGFVGVCVGVAWLYHAFAPRTAKPWELVMHMLQALHLAVLGGLFLGAACCSLLSRWHHWRGYHRCPYCDRSLKAASAWCSCPEMAKLEQEYRALDSALRHTPRPRRRWRVLFAAGVLSTGVLLWPTFTVRQVESRVDPVTGSMMTKTVWPLGITSGPRVEVSPLEVRLRSSGVSWTPSWQFLHNTHHNIYGRATCRACGLTPPIYQLRLLLKEFAAASADEELREFVRVMQFGTEAEQRAVVNAVAEKGVRSLTAARPGN